MNDYNNKNSRKDIDEMSKRILKWLKEDGMYKETVKDERFHFGFVAKNPEVPGGSFVVAQPIPKNDSILVSITVTISEQDSSKLQKMTAKEKTDFWISFNLGILFAKPTFHIRPNQEAPKEIEFRREIYYDGMNKDKLIEAIRDVHRCYFYLNLNLYRQFKGESEPNVPPPSMYG